MAAAVDAFRDMHGAGYNDERAPHPRAANGPTVPTKVHTRSSRNRHHAIHPWRRCRSSHRKASAAASKPPAGMVGGRAYSRFNTKNSVPKGSEGGGVGRGGGRTRRRDHPAKIVSTATLEFLRGGYMLEPRSFRGRSHATWRFSYVQVFWSDCQSVVYSHARTEIESDSSFSRLAATL